MATAVILRSFSRASSRSVLLQMQPLSRCTNNVIVSKQFTASRAVASYFQARRGPFTPEEKRGSGHLIDASTHWKLERYLAAGLCGLVPAALFFQGAAMDHLLTTCIYLHGFWALWTPDESFRRPSAFGKFPLSKMILMGVNIVIGDYVQKFVPWFIKLWYLIAIIGFAGAVNFNYNDVGLTKAITMLWSL